MKNKFYKLEELRLVNGYSIKEIAEKIGISKTFYWQIENKKRNLSYRMAFKIAKSLKLKPDKIFYEEIKNELKQEN